MVHLLHQHVRGGGGEGALVVVLAVDEEPRLRVVVAQVVLRLGQHAAGAAGRVEQGTRRAGGREQVVVVDEQDVHHQPDHLARREVVASGLVCQLVEAADQILEDEAHLLVGYPVRVQVDVGELRNHEVEDVRLVHLLDLVLELEVLEDVAHIGREALDVADEVPGDVVRVALQPVEIEFGEWLWKRWPAAAFSLASSALPSKRSFRRSYSATTFALVGASTQSKRRSTVIGSMTRSYCGGR